MWTRPTADRDTERIERLARAFTSAATAGGSSKRRALLGHKKAVDALAWNRNGTKLASASRDTTIRVWSIDLHAQPPQQQPQQRNAAPLEAAPSIELKGHTDDVSKICWHPIQSDLLASCSQDKSVKLWNVGSSAGAGGRLLYSMNTIGMNLHLKWSPCGRFLLLLNSSNLISLIAWDAATNKLSVMKSIGFPVDINDFCWCPPAATAAAPAAAAASAGPHSTANAAAVAPSTNGAAAAAPPSSDRVILGHQQGSLEIIAIPSLTKLASIPAHGSTVFCMELSPPQAASSFPAGGRYLASGGADAMVHVWDSVEMVLLRSFPRMDDSIRALGWNADSSLLAYGGKDLRIEVSDFATGQRVAVLDTPDETLALAWHPSNPNVFAYANGEKNPRNVGEIILINAAPTASSSSSSSATGAASSAVVPQPRPRESSGSAKPGVMPAAERQSSAPSTPAAASSSSSSSAFSSSKSAAAPPTATFGYNAAAAKQSAADEAAMKD